MQVIKARHRTEFTEHLRFTYPNPVKAVIIYLIFLFGYGFTFNLLLYFIAWIKGDSYQFHFAYLIFSWFCALGCTSATTNKFRDNRLPFFFEKYLLNQALVEDLTQLDYITADATIIDIKTQPKRLFRPQFHTLILQLNDSNEIIHDQHIHLNLLFQSIYFANANYTIFYADQEWIGQQVNISYLSKSKRIFQISAITTINLFEEIQGIPLDSLDIPKKLLLKVVPSKLAQNFLNIQRIEAVRPKAGTWEYQLVLTVLENQIFAIAVQSLNFRALELMLANKIDFLKYREFKQNLRLEYQLLFQKN